MAGRCNITTTEGNALTVSQKTGNTKWNKGKGNCYKRVMADRCNITTTEGNALTVSQKTGNTKWNKGRSNAAI